MNFTHLHLHNEYSVLDGVGTSKQYAWRAKELGQTHLAITNHGNVDGVIEHQKQCLAAGIIPIIGCELYVVDNLTIKEKGDKRYHMTVLVEDEAGWQNLLKILTVANVDGFYYRPRIDIGNLLPLLDGLVVLTGCAMSVLNMTKSELIIEPIIERVGKEKVYLEVMPHDLKDQVNINKKCIELSKYYGLKLVATNDCHYPKNEAAKYQEVLLAIQSRAKMSDKDRWKFSIDGLYLKSREEMRRAFRRQVVLNTTQIDDALNNTMLIAEMCGNFRIKKREPELPSVFKDEVYSDKKMIRTLIREGRDLRLSHLDNTAKKLYRERVEEELSLISDMKFERYFLIVWDLINWCKKNNIMTGPGRGSVGGSLVAYLLGITDVDPIKYDLVFSRFISPDRIDLPDIDMDFEDHKRHLVREYLQNKYGEYNVAGLSTFMTMKGKGAFRDVCRVYDIPLKQVDGPAKAIDDSIKENQIELSFNTIPECMFFKKKNPEIIETATALEGQVRGVGQHAAAVCISSTDLREGYNCNLSIRSGQVVANWGKDNAEFMGLVKLDILGLSALSVLNECKAMVKRNHGQEIDFNAIPLDDPKVYAQINKGNVTGAFQIGAGGLSRFCQEMVIDNFDYLVAATALYRPGPLHSGMAEKFIKIKHGKAKRKLIHPIYDKITDPTIGIIVYQEQVMSVINQLSGLDMASCDKIRKLMAKSKGEAAINEYRKRFLDGCAELKTVNKKMAQEIWRTVSTFGAYGFNKAHSVEYSMITFWDMWLKTYYPEEFIACSLTYGSKEQFKSYLREARRLKLEIRLPKIDKAHAKNWSVDDSGNLFAPFICIDGIGEKMAYKIAEHKPVDKKRKGFFQLRDENGAIASQVIPGVNKKIMAILNEIEAFKPLGKITEEEKQIVREILL